MLHNIMVPEGDKNFLGTLREFQGAIGIASEALRFRSRVSKNKASY